MTANGKEISQDAAMGLLPDDHALWQQHSGGSGHEGPEWDLNDDLSRAQAFYSEVTGKAKIVFDLLIDHPGRPLSVTDIRAMTGDIFSNSYSVAGSIQGLYLPHEASERRYPFYWWKGRPTQYGIKPQVAELFG